MSINAVYNGKMFEVPRDNEYMIKRIEKDIENLGEMSIGFALFAKVRVKVPFADKYVFVDIIDDYFLDKSEIGFMRDEEWTVGMSLGEIRELFVGQNSDSSSF